MGRPIGRRPGDPQDTRDEILAAARELFAELGYERATIRAIAARANVDAGLVIHHYSNKTKLFAAAHELPFDPADLMAHVAAFPVADRGREVAHAYFTALAAPNSPALSMLRSAATNHDAAEFLNEFITAALLTHANSLTPGPDSEQRLALAGAHLLGVVFARNIVHLAPLSAATIDDLVRLIAPALQTYFDG